MPQKALVTGGAGFIGSHVADLFLAQGYEVTIVDNLASGRRENLPAGARFVEASITSPEAAALVRDGGFDVVLHLAAQIDVRKSVTDPVFDATQNVLGSLTLLEAGRQAKLAGGKVNVWVGDADDYFLNNAVHRFRAAAAGLKEPAFDGVIEIAPRRGHGSGWSNAKVLDAMAARAGK